MKTGLITKKDHYQAAKEDLQAPISKFKLPVKADLTLGSLWEQKITVSLL